MTRGSHVKRKTFVDEARNPPPARIVRLRAGHTRLISHSFRLTADEYLILKKAATKARLSISDYIRQCLPLGGIVLSHYYRRTP